jgi:hypothetical protein
MGARNKSTSLWYTGLLMVRTELCGVGIHKTAIIFANDSVGELNLGVITKISNFVHLLVANQNYKLHLLSIHS